MDQQHHILIITLTDFLNYTYIFISTTLDSLFGALLK